MPVLLQVDFPFNGPFGKDMAASLDGLARSINDEPGFLWKIWTENERGKIAGGIYLFAEEKSALAYLEMHTKRLQDFGISEVNAKLFDVNETLTTINSGPVA